MKNLPHYTKVIGIGGMYTENALVGEVVLQEKVDGSQFRFGVNEDSRLIIGSKGTIIHPPVIQKLFRPAVKHLLSMEKKITKNYKPDTYFFAETLQKPKHNVQKYERVPKNHIVLFDVSENQKWVGRERLIEIAKDLDIDVVPELYRGVLNTGRQNKSGLKVSSPAVDFLKKTIETTPSYLGNELVEGVVIKNYTQTIMLGGQVFPLFTKMVREKFKEKHDLEWKTKHPKTTLQDYINGFKTEARWQKAFLHLEEKGELAHDLPDIGKLMKEVMKDVQEEEAENIKNHLFKVFIKDILRKSTHGLPEWYKGKLMENIE